MRYTVINIKNFDDYINEWMLNYNNLTNEENKIDNYMSITFCSKTSAYHILQIQPKAKLSVDRTKGLYIVDDNDYYKNKLLKSLEISYDYMYDLVLTPEYSVPLSVIDQLISDEKRIRHGTLYCLCCNGMPCDDFDYWINKYNNNDDIVICSDSWNLTPRNRIVCCLIYLTKVRFSRKGKHKFDKVFIIPQFKTRSMKDECMNFEYDVLTCGNEIVVFGKEKEDYFLSMICADVFNYELISEIKNYLTKKKKKALIFHPQLNLRPQHNNFRFTRDLLMDYAENDSIRVIALNWAKGTKFDMAGTEIPAITDSWSTIYKAYSPHDFSEYMAILDGNVNKGLNFAHDYQMAMFFFPSSEHTLDISMKDLLNSNAPAATRNTVFLKINNYYEYSKEQNSMVDKSDLCKEMIDDFFWSNEEFVRFFTEKNGIKKCNMEMLNEFVSLVYESDLPKQFEIINNGKISSISAKHYKSIYSREKLYICKRVYKKIKDREVPVKFKSHDPNIIFDVQKKSDLLKYNVEYQIDTQKDVYCRVVYLKYAKERDAAKIYDEFLKKDKSYAENLIIYFEDEEKVKLFEQGISTSIVKGEITQNQGSIMGGLIHG